MPLEDVLAPGLKAVFVGTSVATASASRGHYYSGPGNKFWEFLWDAGFTGDRLLVPEQDRMLLKFGLGLSDVVKGRDASSDALLRVADYDAGGFVRKMEQFAPISVAFNGREAAKRVARHLKQPEPELGLAEWKIASSFVWVLPSSSGSSAAPSHYLPKSSKVEWWQEFSRWLKNSP